MYGQVVVDMEFTGDENGMTSDEIKSAVDHLIEQGFTPRTYQNRAGTEDNIGKRGTVVKVEPVPNTKMFLVTGKLDESGTEFTWKAFRATDARKDDRFEVIKNDRGFKEGMIVLEPDTQKKMPF